MTKINTRRQSTFVSCLVTLQSFQTVTKLKSVRKVLTYPVARKLVLVLPVQSMPTEKLSC